MNRFERSEVELERRKLVSTDVRDLVIDRDGSCCRVCGRYVTEPGLHHVIFRSHGGLDTPENLVVVGWAPGHDCHLTYAHGAESHLWQRLLLICADVPAVTAFALRRWEQEQEVGVAFSFDQVVTRFWERVDRLGPDDCWEWTGSRASYGYGQFSAKGFSRVPIRAHTFSFFLANGRWPRPMCLHRCDNPPCVNPAHLYEGDQTQNMADRKLRKPRFGAANPAARHASVVDEIRRRHAAGESQASIGRTLHLNSSVVSRIVRGINYPPEA